MGDDGKVVEREQRSKTGVPGKSSDTNRGIWFLDMAVQST